MLITDTMVLQELTLLDIQMDSTTDAEEYDEFEKQHRELEKQLYVETFVFEKDGKYGIKSNCQQGEVIIAEAVYEQIISDYEGCIARNGNEWSIFYESGGCDTLHLDCDELQFSQIAGYLLVRKDALWGLFDADHQQWAIAPVCQQILQEQGHYLYQVGTKWGYMDCAWHIPAEYDCIKLCRHQGYARFYKSGEMGFIDKDGQWTPHIELAELWTEIY